MSRTVAIVGVPMDLGGNRRGVDMGPSAIRYAGLAERLARLGFEVQDAGNVVVADPEEGRATHEHRKTDQRDLVHRGRPHHVDEIVRVAEELAKRVEHIEKRGAFPLVLGGDHSMSMGTLAGIARAGRRAGVIWMDAHGDINTPATTPSGNVHGMPFAVALGLAEEPFPKSLRASVDGRSAALIALRSVDPGEKENIKAAGVTGITMADIDRLGMSAAMEKAYSVAVKGGRAQRSLVFD